MNFCVLISAPTFTHTILTCSLYIAPPIAPPATITVPIAPIEPPPAPQLPTTSTGDSTTEDELSQRGSAPVATCHGRDWYTADTDTTRKMKKVPLRQWAVKDAFGEKVYPGTNRNLSRLDAFMMLFPREQFNAMIEMTNRNLAKEGLDQTTLGELVKFIGVIIMMTRVKMRVRRDLWNTSARSRYLPAYNFGSMGLSRHRWEQLWKHVRWSEQPPSRPQGMTHERWRWSLISDFVDRFNEHRATRFIPSDALCMEESMSKWYGLGGGWINIGLPMYIAIDRKPVNGCEIQNVCCARSRIMMQIKIVETAEEEDTHAREDQDGMLHGTSVMINLLKPWHHDGERVVCGDSYFASVSAVTEMKKVGIRFIGVIKTATKQFPMAYLSSQEVIERGNSHALYTKDQDGEVELLAVMWVDRDRRYFVANTETMQQAEPIFRIRWRQVDETTNAEPERQELTLEQPSLVKCYYDTCSSIDRHNKQRQDDLELERTVNTKDWWKRVCLSILGMILVDTCNFHQACVHAGDIDSDPDTFWTGLAEEMVDNQLDGICLRSRRSRFPVATSDSSVQVNYECHLTPTTEKKRKANGELTNYTLQGNCRVCHKKTSYVCSTCERERREDPDIRILKPWYCHKKSRRSCFSQHLETEHS